MHFPGNQRTGIGRPSRIESTALRQIGGFAVCTGLILTLLLFPAASTANTFNICNLYQGFPAISGLNLQQQTSAQSARNVSELFCATCLWSSFENAFPATPVIIYSSSTSMATFIPYLPFSSEFHNFLPGANRAPPIS